MKKIYIIAAVSFLAIAKDTKADSAYRFELEETDTIQKSCVQNGVTQKSKMKLIFQTSAQTASYFTLKIKTALCTKGYGFREVNIWINLPNALYDPKNYSALNIGENNTFQNIPSTNVTNKMLTIMLSRSSKTQYDIIWPQTPSGNNEYLPVKISYPDPRSLNAVRGFNENYHVAWQKVVIPYKHPRLSNPFILSGKLISVDEE